MSHRGSHVSHALQSASLLAAASKSVHVARPDDTDAWMIRSRKEDLQTRKDEASSTAERDYRQVLTGRHRSWGDQTVTTGLGFSILGKARERRTNASVDEVNWNNVRVGLLDPRQKSKKKMAGTRREIQRVKMVVGKRKETMVRRARKWLSSGD